jgi:hypothetical protein
MDVFTGWTERFDDYVDYCMQDTILLKKIDEENHVLNFFMSLQRICGVSFPSCHNVTRFASFSVEELTGKRRLALDKRSKSMRALSFHLPSPVDTRVWLV